MSEAKDALLLLQEKCEQGRQEEQKDADLVQGHTRVMDGVEGFDGKPEPFRVKSVRPVVGPDEYRELTEQEPVVDGPA